MYNSEYQMHAQKGTCGHNNLQCTLQRISKTLIKYYYMYSVRAMYRARRLEI